MKIYDNLSMHAGEPAGTSLQRMNIVFSFLKDKGLVITDTMKDQIDDSMLNEKGKAYMDRVSDSIRAIAPNELQIQLDQLYESFEKEYNAAVSADSIVVEAKYFTNIEIAIKSINEYFASNFTKQDFVMINEDVEIESNILGFINTCKKVDPVMISNPDAVYNVIEEINNEAQEVDDPNNSPYQVWVSEDNTKMLDLVESFIAFKKIQFVADNFAEFTNVIQGLYSLKIYTNPSDFKASIQKMESLTIDEISDIFGEGDIDPAIITPVRIVNSVFENNLITLPEGLTKETEITRVQNFTNLDKQIVINDVPVDEYYTMEAAEVNYFKETNPSNIKYDQANDKFIVSKQLKTAINDLLDGIKKCDTTDQLKEFFASCVDPSIMIDATFPFILAKVFGDKKKYQNEIQSQETLRNYISSYSSIANKNKGARRFIAYDLFTFFKTDKEGTIKFLEDFLTLNLYNNKEVIVENNKLLTVFNIFDSHIYFEILYNLLPNKDKSVIEFIKEARKRVNHNSHTANPYKADESEDIDKPQTSKQIHESAIDRFLQYGDDISISDMMLCEGYRDILMDEILAFEDEAYNHNLSQIQIKNYIGESYNVFQEIEQGAIPDYMKNRIGVSDEPDAPPAEPVDIPKEDIPSNPIDDLINSVNSKLDADGDIEDKLGLGYENNPHKNAEGKQVVYNITYNYNNSFNKDNHSVTTKDNHSSYDLSSNKTTNTKISDSYNNPKKTRKNNNNNVSSIGFGGDKTPDTTLKSGKTVNEVFAFLESSEPHPNSGTKSKPPKEDPLTKAMDKDREKLGKHQERKRKVQKALGTGKAILKPFSRTKRWLIKMVDGLIERDENAVKAQIVESKSYRTALYKATRLALKLGLTGIAFTISGYLGAAYLGIQGLKLADRSRLRNEVEEEFATEIEILNDKIAQAEKDDTPESRKAKWQMMRMRSKMLRIAGSASKSHVLRPNEVS